MMIGYFDESKGNDDDPLAFTVGGYVATEAAWEAFEQRWLRLMAEAGVSGFHMSEFENRKGAYRDWNDKKRLSVISAVADTITSSDLFAFSCTVYQPEFDRIYVSRIRPQDRELFGSPYTFCMRGCMQHIAQEIEAFKLPPEPVALVFEQGTKIVQKASTMYEALRDGRRWRQLFHSITFSSANPPLEAADVLAYESFRYAKNLKRRPDIPRRKLFRRLVAGDRTNVRVHNEETLRVLVAMELDEQRKRLRDGRL